MTLWRVGALRLLRTGRVRIIVGAYALFGVVGALTARFLPQLIERFGGGLGAARGGDPTTGCP